MTEAGAAQCIVGIVDDDAFIRTALGRLVRSIGCEVAVFDSATALLAYSELDDLACVLADLQMPGMGGLELIRLLAQRGPVLPVVAMTAYPTDAIKQRALAAGAFDYLTKPFDAGQLVTCLRALGVSREM